jgi:macrolide-specific efflux system membrane fusion protein
MFMQARQQSRRAPPRSRERYIRASVAVAAVLCMLPALLVVKRAASTDRAPQYLTAPVLRIDLESAVQATGVLEGHHQVDVGAQVSGQLQKLHVRLGDLVQAGAPLADIDPVLSRNALRIAESNLQSLEAQRRASAAGLTQARLALRRQQAMLVADATSVQEVEGAQAQLDAVEANIASFDAQIRQARAQVESAAASLAYTHITAPIRGEVVALVTQEGQTVVSAQQAPVILRLADRSTMTVKAQISEADVIRLRPGLPAWFTVLGNAAERFDGVVRAIEPVPGDYLTGGGKPGPVFYNAVFDVANRDGRLRIGMTAQVAIVLARAPGALAIPMSALGPADSTGRYAIRVIRQGAPVTLRVSLGVRDNVRVQVLDGVHEGDLVITDEAPRSSALPDLRQPV